MGRCAVDARVRRFQGRRRYGRLDARRRSGAALPWTDPLRCKCQRHGSGSSPARRCGGSRPSQPPLPRRHPIGKLTNFFESDKLAGANAEPLPPRLPPSSPALTKTDARHRHGLRATLVSLLLPLATTANDGTACANSKWEELQQLGEHAKKSVARSDLVSRSTCS
jgi:hypothetical protein